MTTLPFTTSPTDQVRLNLIHYNLWTQVDVHNDYILSGLPPAKLVSTDADAKREWVVCTRLNEQDKLSVKEINSWFEEIKSFTKESKEEKSVKLNTTSDTNEHNDQQPSTFSKVPSTETKSLSGNNSDSIWKPVDKTMNGKGRVDRITIALINDDGTIVYYFIHDGITKPRQN
ncbi:SEN15 [Candida theae]|uniref:SEN15 n=1 Tax=Candida theae TaxID=1198502 RepID=A0AAD5BH17_9ASCO|nr:SEN15 [Candida theae]KAI5961533.1 SEN15 [Candida theae]